MKISAIRGATTCENNKDSIQKATLILYNEIIEKNRLKPHKIIAVIAGSTNDLTAFYPATALRLSGVEAPLFSTTEPQIDGSLPLCIRLLLLVKCKNPCHIYQENAKNLRQKPPQ